jgi:hypothetical protein
VTRDREILFFSCERRRDDVRIIIGLKAANRDKLCERVDDAQLGLAGLPGAQLAAVPHDCGPGALLERGERHLFRLFPAARRKRPRVIDFSGQRIAVMNQKNELSH